MRARVASTLTMSPLHGHSETTYSEGSGHAGKGWIAGLREAGYQTRELASMVEEGALQRIVGARAHGTTHALHSQDYSDYIREHGGRDTEVRVVACSRLLRGTGLKPLPPKPVASHLDPETQEQAASLRKLCDDVMHERLPEPKHQAGAVGVDVHYALGRSEFMHNPHVVDESLRHAEGKIEAAQAKVSAEKAGRLVKDIQHIYNDVPWAIHGPHAPPWDPQMQAASAAKYQALLEDEKARCSAAQEELQEPEDDYSPPLRAVDLPAKPTSLRSPPAGENGSPRISNAALMAEMDRTNELPPSELPLPNRYQKTIAQAKANAIYRKDINAAARQIDHASYGMLHDFGPRAPRPAPPAAREPWKAPVLRTGRLF